MVILFNASYCLVVEPEFVGKYSLLSLSFLTLSFQANTSFAPISNMIRVSAPISSAGRLSMLDCFCVGAMSMSVDDGVMQRSSRRQRLRRVVRSVAESVRDQRYHKSDAELQDSFNYSNRPRRPENCTKALPVDHTGCRDDYCPDVQGSKEPNEYNRNTRFGVRKVIHVPYWSFPHFTWRRMPRSKPKCLSGFIVQVVDVRLQVRYHK